MLSNAQAAANAALAAVQAAKLAFFDASTDERRAAVADAERKYADAKLDLERAQHADAAALAAEEEAERGEQATELEALQATDRERQAKIDAAVLELVEIERKAHALIGKISEVTRLRQGDYARRKQLSLLLDRSSIEKPPPTDSEARINLAVEIRRARQADGRDMSPSELVPTWLQPAMRVIARAG